MVRLASRLAGSPRPDQSGVVIFIKLKGKLDLSVRVSSSSGVLHSKHLSSVGLVDDRFQQDRRGPCRLE